jgi:hypothetical protein
MDEKWMFNKEEEEKRERWIQKGFDVTQKQKERQTAAQEDEKIQYLLDNYKQWNEEIAIKLEEKRLAQMAKEQEELELGKTLLIEDHIEREMELALELEYYRQYYKRKRL